MGCNCLLANAGFRIFLLPYNINLILQDIKYMSFSKFYIWKAKKEFSGAKLWLCKMNFQNIIHKNCWNALIKI